ncbi:MAG TPA: pyridoxal-phosphate dependent enzyme [Longimicrobiales bacterium]|nr:pyridoxal-phosphate dependent enzyme [Longimicrobiales bacterium]
MNIVPAAGIQDRTVYDRAIERFRQARIALPTFGELARPEAIPADVASALTGIGPDEPHALNLFRVHWYNDGTRRVRTAVPDHVVLPRALTGVDAPIILALGNRFPMIAAHKVLAAYACLVPRILAGEFDPAAHRAVWPSTGNYCRGGVAISRIMGCRGVAVLPEGMSAERFRWLEQWVADPADIVRTPGTESNVKEIYDECRELARDERNVILNQFSEFGNYLVHHLCTGRALAAILRHHQASSPRLRAAAFVSASGSAGTLGAGDALKDEYGARVVAVEALECPTLLQNGFGAHNIQGIGDKHVPLIHNVMNTDVVVAVSDRSTDQLGLLFSHREGLRYVADRRGVPEEVVTALRDIGISGICNIVAAIKVAKQFGYGPDDAILTVATDGAAMYDTEFEKVLRRDFRGSFDAVSAAEAFGEHLLGAGTDHLLELDHEDRLRIFNLGYYTWVEQQGVATADFVARRSQVFWRNLQALIPAWDEGIMEFNARTGVRAPF